MDNTYLPAGKLLQGGRYRIIRFISSGGFGCTYEAEHVKLGKRLAIKEFFVKDFCNRDEATLAVTVGTTGKTGLVKRLADKFSEEARALSMLNHPGIVKVSDVFDENGTSYFVMDYVDGKSLGEIVKLRGALTEDLAVHFIRQVAQALKYVHSHNRLHLDVKPGNIMVNKEGNAILIDFGASKQYDEVEGENTSTLLGKTPGYAPIEQMGNDVVVFHPSTDIYALGGTLYKLLTGKTPMSATRRVSGEEMEPLPETVSPQVRMAVEKAMELNKNHRPQSIDEFLAILDGVAEDGDAREFINDVVDDDDATRTGGLPDYDDIPDSEPEAPGRKKLIIAAAGVLALCIAGCLAFFMYGNKEKTGQSAQVDEQTVEQTEEGVVAAEHDVTDSIIVVDEKTKMKYTGTVNAEGLPDGKGHAVYEFADSKGEYEGMYRDGKREGEGRYKFEGKDGANVFEGTFENDQYKKGKLVDSKSGYYFNGTFSDGMPYDGQYFTNYGVKFQTVKRGKRI